MATTTTISTTEADDFARRLRALVTPETVSKIGKLKTIELEAGPPGMNAAEWLEAIVGDRRAAVVEHLNYLDTVFEGMATAVQRVAAVLTGVDASADLAAGALNTWIDQVNGVKIPALPPGVKTTYDTGDTGGDPQMLWQVGPTGTHAGTDPNIVINLPDGKAGLPNQQLFDEYGKIISDAHDGEKPPALIYTDDGRVIKPGDPEN
ncbi:hypothetical protein AB0H83_22020 [Dactylosporangium sp. NPDC050688]|uniref:hypothetical protein n=1 Tax=Dactylosporangium sp. NPDC050688 TaxID=3157217 RepID=UPI0033DADD57